MKKILSTILVALIFLLASNSSASVVNNVSREYGKTGFESMNFIIADMFVDDGFNETTSGWQINHFDNIQDAINKASYGNIIYVYNGTYHENLVINQTVSLIGENKNATFIKNGKVGDHFSNGPIDIEAENVVIKGFTINNAMGIWIKKFTNNHTICENIITDQDYPFSALYFSKSNNNKVYNNFLNRNIEFGGINNIISNNNLVGGHIWGYNGSNCKVFNNTVINSTYGIRLWKCCNNLVYNNIVKGYKYSKWIINGQGIELYENCSGNEIFNNNLLINSMGLDISKNCNNNLIYNNNISDTTHGIKIRSSNFNDVHHNNFINCKIKALFIKCKNNKWSHNYWGESRILPKVILGTRGIFGLIPWFNVDWFPAFEPNEV